MYSEILIAYIISLFVIFTQHKLFSLFCSPQRTADEYEHTPQVTVDFFFFLEISRSLISDSPPYFRANPLNKTLKLVLCDEWHFQTILKE